MSKNSRAAELVSVYMEAHPLSGRRLLTIAYDVVHMYVTCTEKGQSVSPSALKFLLVDDTASQYLKATSGPIRRQIEHYQSSKAQLHDYGYAQLCMDLTNLTWCNNYIVGCTLWPAMLAQLRAVWDTPKIAEHFTKVFKPDELPIAMVGLSRLEKEVFNEDA